MADPASPSSGLHFHSVNKSKPGHVIFSVCNTPVEMADTNKTSSCPTVIGIANREDGLRSSLDCIPTGFLHSQTYSGSSRYH